MPENENSTGAAQPEETARKPSADGAQTPPEPADAAPQEAPAAETAGQEEEETEKDAKSGREKGGYAERAALKTKLEQAEKALAEMKDRWMRAAAEFDNFRKRSAREHDAAFDDGVSFAVNALLPVLDTLELAANAETADEGYKKGVLMTLTKCEESFGKMGVREIEAQGKSFDPTLHAAVMQQPATEECPSGTVTQVLQKGYTLHDKVVRHAGVAVAV